MKKTKLKPKVTKTLTKPIEFTLQHVVLYAKHWYHRSDDIVEDLKKCLTADNYSGETFSKNDVVRLLLHRLEELPKNNSRSLSNFYHSIQPKNCWSIGYSCTINNGLPEYDSEIAAIYFCLNIFRFIDPKEWKPCVPDFDRVLPRASHVSDESLIALNSLIQNTL